MVAYACVGSRCVREYSRASVSNAIRMTEPEKITSRERRQRTVGHIAISLTRA